MAQRSAPKAYWLGNGPLSTGSVVVPPWIHSAPFGARSAWGFVSSIVVAPWMVWRAIGRPRSSRRGTDASVVVVVSAPETTDRDPHGPVTLLPAIALPIVNVQPVIGAQLGWTVCSTSGSTSWPALYGVSTPRSRRLSWMLLRARLAVMSW